jgi:hypothetical protein
MGMREYDTAVRPSLSISAVIDPESGAAHDVSFFNLVELHIVAAPRRQHRIHMANIRAAIDYLKGS